MTNVKKCVNNYLRLPSSRITIYMKYPKNISPIETNPQIIRCVIPHSIAIVMMTISAVSLFFEK